MTDQQHPITPPPELYAQWRKEAPLYNGGYVQREVWFMDRAAEWGWDQRGTINEAQLQERADQELEACCDWLYNDEFTECNLHSELRAARRPKPLSLKEDALAAVSVPQELLRQWCQSKPGLTPDELWRKIADNSAQWGADQELEACCEHIGDWFATPEYRRAELRAARRPKPASLKEQALSDFAHLMGELIGTERYKDRIASLRRALEALPND